MILKDIFKKGFFVYAPFVFASAWILLSVISIFTIDSSILSDPFVIISIIFRVLLSLFSLFLIRKLYIVKGLTTVSYNHYLNIVGYSITLTYVFYMLPQVVRDFNGVSASSPWFTIGVFILALAPLFLYLLLKSDKVKLALGYFTQKELDCAKRCKKDKVLKKKEAKRLRKERNMFQNAWFEFLDPLFWAIIWVLILNNFIAQLYVIPSSSMVPTFLEKDRVVASKLFSGPGIPLTNYQIPEVTNPNPGDIVTFNNPKVDDLTSDIHYKNVFTRIFQPFVYMLTFTKLDIDADANGNPKVRQLVKRVIGVPGDKLCMVNDKVYKKIEGGEWTLMSDIPGQKEWGQNALFSLTNKNSGNQMINPKIRESLDRAANLAIDSDVDELSRMVDSELAKFVKNIESGDKEKLLLRLLDYNSDSIDSVKNNLEQIEKSYKEMMNLNRSNISLNSKKSIVQQFDRDLDNYSDFTLFNSINNLGLILQKDKSEIENGLDIKIGLPADPSPYDTFVTKLDGVIKLKTLKLYNELFTMSKVDPKSQLIEDLKVLSLYVNGLQFIQYSYPFFGAGNLPEYPAAKDSYIPDNEYFVLGDNRYNSLDSRMGESYSTLPLVEDLSLLAESVYVSWEPHTINSRYIRGRVRFIVTPFSRLKAFF